MTTAREQFEAIAKANGYGSPLDDVIEVVQYKQFPDCFWILAEDDEDFYITTWIKTDWSGTVIFEDPDLEKVQEAFKYFKAQEGA